MTPELAAGLTSPRELLVDAVAREVNRHFNSAWRPLRVESLLGVTLESSLRFVDLSIPLFPAARALGVEPDEIATIAAAALRAPGGFVERTGWTIEAARGYVNAQVPFAEASMAASRARDLLRDGSQGTPGPAGGRLVVLIDDDPHGADCTDARRAVLVEALRKLGHHVDDAAGADPQQREPAVRALLNADPQLARDTSSWATFLGSRTGDGIALRSARGSLAQAAFDLFDLHQAATRVATEQAVAVIGPIRSAMAPALLRWLTARHDGIDGALELIDAQVELPVPEWPTLLDAALARIEQATATDASTTDGFRYYTWRLLDHLHRVLGRQAARSLAGQVEALGHCCAIARLLTGDTHDPTWFRGHPYHHAPPPAARQPERTY